MPERTDLELVEAAIEKAGNAARLAAIVGLKPNTPNEWRHRLRQGGRLSRDKRHRLEVYLKGDRPADVRAALDRETELARERESARVEVLLELVEFLRQKLHESLARAGNKELAARARRQLRRV